MSCAPTLFPCSSLSPALARTHVAEPHAQANRVEMIVTEEAPTEFHRALELLARYEVGALVVMEGGRIIEQGSFRDLLDRQGRFAQMWQLQLQDADHA